MADVQMAQVERPGAVTLMNKAFTLVGPELKVGQKAPDFEVLGTDLAPVTLHDSAGKVRIVSVIPSLDTPVCDSQTRRFNEEAARLPGIEILTVSMDLPFAQKRWCEAAGVDKVKTLSDHRDGSFGKTYGTLIKELRLETRAVFVIDQKDTVRYAEYVPVVGNHPDYEAALEAARKLLP